MSITSARSLFCDVARHGLPRGDISYTTGCCFRAITCLAHSLCALNEKDTIALAAHLPLTIDAFAPRVAAIYATLPQGTNGPPAALTILSDLIAQAQSLLSSLCAFV